MMKSDPTKYALVDGVVKNYLEGSPSLWVLEQGLYTSQQRRLLLGALNIESRARILDAGCGYGICAFDFVGQLDVAVDGVDFDSEKLSVAREIQSQLDSQDYFVKGSELTFTQGSLETLPFEDSRFDFAISSFVFQHLSDPQSCADELYRVTKPGGSVCLIDADDGLSLVYPQVSDAYSKLSDAFDAYQLSNGGDRQVGRKLATYLDGAGFEITSVIVMPVAEYKGSQTDDKGRTFVIERFRQARDSIIEAGLLGPEEFDQCLDLYSKEASMVQFRTNSQLVVIAKRP